MIAAEAFTLRLQVGRRLTGWPLALAVALRDLAVGVALGGLAASVPLASVPRPGWW